jgi:transposase-like protein
MARGYRNSGRQTSFPRVLDKSQVLAGRVGIEVPLSVAEIIEGVGQEVEQLAGEAGLLIMRAVMDAEVESLAGPKGRHDPDRTSTRWTAQPGYVVLAGKKVKITKPRVRDKAGHEVPLSSYQQFQSAPRRQASIYKKLVNGISTRKYEQAIDDFTEGYGISRSAVSRQMVEATRGALQKLCERRIDELGPLAVLMIDGKQLHGECVIIALGVDLQGKKHTLGLVQGATESSVVVQHLLDDLVERGLDAARPMLIVLDGSKALRKAVRQTFGDRSPVQRCQIHKRRNVKELLPKEYQRSVDQRMRTAYGMKDYEQAKAQLEKTAAWLEGINPSAAASLREGLEETLTLHRLGLPEPLRQSFQSTNLIESALSVASDVSDNVKRWRAGDMRLRWIAAGMLAAEKQFRRVRGHKLMPKLVSALGSKAIAGESQAA